MISLANPTRAALLIATLLSLASCHRTGTQSSSTESSPPGSTSTLPVMVSNSPTKWLCFPGESDDPCSDPLDYTSIGADGSQRVVKVNLPKHPPIDCFYVYPTISTQTTPNANLDLEPAETNVAMLQASRFSQECRVYAPMYRQATLPAIFNGYEGVDADEIYKDIVGAWNDYLSHYNDGRGVVLIGHSQGSFVLEQLMKQVVEPSSRDRALIVSAVLLGGNVNAGDEGQEATSGNLAPQSIAGWRQGVLFSDFPPCSAAGQTSCVVAYSSFDAVPPSNARFGTTTNPGVHVACVNPGNPSAAEGDAAALVPFFPTTEVPVLLKGSKPSVSTPWVSYPDLFTAACQFQQGTSWLQVDDVRVAGDARPNLTESLGPTWGLHLIDANIALGNLVDIVHDQSVGWSKTHRLP